MALLIDQNLSHLLVRSLSALWPGCLHVRQLGLERASDLDVWDCPRTNGLAILSRDGDFHQLCLLHGAPPKVVWLRVCNQSSRTIETMIVSHRVTIDKFLADVGSALLVIDP